MKIKWYVCYDIIWIYFEEVNSRLYFVMNDICLFINFILL